MSNEPKAVYLGWAENNVSKQVEELVRNRFHLLFSRHCRFGETLDQDAVAPLGADYLFSFGPLLVRPPLLNRIRVAAVNFHTGPPRWPGRGSVSFALLHNDAEFGVTAHLMTEAVDAGPILHVHRFSIQPDDDVASLDARTKGAIPELVTAVLDKLVLSGPIPCGERWERQAMTQDDLLASMRIEHDDAAATVAWKVRAFAHPTKPGPYMERAGRRFWYLGGERGK